MGRALLLIAVAEIIIHIARSHFVVEKLAPSVRIIGAPRKACALAILGAERSTLLDAARCIGPCPYVGWGWAADGVKYLCEARDRHVRARHAA